MPDTTKLITTEQQFKSIACKTNPEEKLFDIALFFDEGYEAEDHLYDGEVLLNEPDSLSESISLLEECYILLVLNIISDGVDK